MLLRTIAEIRAVIPTSNLKDDARLPNIMRAEVKYILPVIGKPLYDRLEVAYSEGAGQSNSHEKELIKHIQLPLAALSMHDDLGFIHTLITNTGVRRAGTGDLPGAYRWEYEELKNSLLQMGMEGLEFLHEYLFLKKADFELWTNDQVYQRYLKQVIKGGREFASIYPIYQPYRTFSSLLPIMQMVRDMYLIPMMGEGVVNYFVEAENLSDHGKSALSYIKKATAILVIKHACEQLPVRFTDQGFTVLSGGQPDREDAGRSAATEAAITKKMEAAYRDGSAYLARAKNEIVAMFQDGRLEGDLSEEFRTAFTDSPLNKTQPVIDPDMGNSRRKIFRFG